MSDLIQLRRPVAESTAPKTAPTRTVYLETYGCQMNVADSDLMLGLLDRDGYARTDDPAAADLILINTCAVREKAEERVFARASMLGHGKARPDVVLGITGCMAEHLKDELRRRAPHVDVVIGPDGYRRLLDHVESATDFDLVSIKDQKILLPTHAEVLSCERGSFLCSRNAIDFRNYHAYTGESSITFDKQ